MRESVFGYAGIHGAANEFEEWRVVAERVVAGAAAWLSTKYDDATLLPMSGASLILVKRLTRPLEARPDFTFCAGGDRPPSTRIARSSP